MTFKTDRNSRQSFVDYVRPDTKTTDTKAAGATPADAPAETAQSLGWRQDGGAQPLARDLTKNELTPAPQRGPMRPDALNPSLDAQRGRPPLARTTAFPEGGEAMPSPHMRTMAHPEGGEATPSPLMRTMAHPEGGETTPSPQLRTAAFPEDGGALPNLRNEAQFAEFARAAGATLSTMNTPAGETARSLNTQLLPSPLVRDGVNPEGVTQNVQRFVAMGPNEVEVQHRGALSDEQKKGLEQAMRDPALTSPLKDGMKVTYRQLPDAAPVDTTRTDAAKAKREQIAAQLNDPRTTLQLANRAEQLGKELETMPEHSRKAEKAHTFELLKSAADGAKGLRDNLLRDALAAVMPSPERKAEREVAQSLLNGGVDGLASLVKSSKDPLTQRMGATLLGVYTLETVG